MGRPSASTRPMPTRRSSSTRYRATRRCSPELTRSRRRGASSTRSSAPGPTAPPTFPNYDAGHGGPTLPTSCSPATAAAGANLVTMFIVVPAPTRADPALVGPSAPDRRDRDRAVAHLGSQDLAVRVEGETTRHIAARTNVMNLIVVARRPEFAEKCAATVQMLTGRHPSRTIVIQSADPDGPSWLDARVEAHCVMPRAGRPRDLRRDHPRDLRRRIRAGIWRRSRPH